MRPGRQSEGFTLIELLIVIIIIGILSAIAIPMFLNQRDKAKNAAVKGGIHSIELGLATYAVDHADTYPAAVDDRADLVSSGGVAYVDNWPDNPWSGDPMVQGDDVGDYRYTQTGGGTGFILAGHMSDADFLVP